MKNHIVKETQREAIVNRPHNLAGSIKGIKRARFNITEDGVNFTETTTTPALIKLFMEALDNPIDVGIKSNQNIKIDIKVTPKEIQVKDNGFGIPSIKDKEDNWQAYSAFCEYNTSSNYKENRGQGQKGVNGIGVKLCTTLSKKMVVDSDDGKKKIVITATENNLKHKIIEKPSTGSGVSVKFQPDFDIFDVDEITPEHIQRMYEYTLIQALTYPNLTFRFNNKTLRLTPKKFMSMFPNSVLSEHEDYFIAIAPNDYDDFKQLSFVNGLETYLGGTHIDWITDNIVYHIRTKLQKKKMFKTIKPGDIKNKLMLIVIAKDMKNVDWDGQTKASITSPRTTMKDYFTDLNYDILANKIIRTPEIIDNITEFFKIKEEVQKRKELNSLNKTKKKIKSEKYLPATKRKRFLLVCEGASAVGGLMPAMGREDYGYYELKGVPLNAYEAPQAKFTNNTELSELYQIAQNEGYEYILTATDADADGSHIKGLLLGFFERYLPEYLEAQRFGELRTPVQAGVKNGKIIHWVYNLGELKLKTGETGKYFKGLGSWKAKDLKQVVQKDGIQHMINLFNVDSLTVLDDWMSGKKSDKRKEYLNNNTFDITEV